jgi:short-subunit dehydrogenase
MKSNSMGKALITGSSSGMGAIYANRLALRGYDLVLVGKDREQLEMVARRNMDDTDRSIQVVVADLTSKDDLCRIEDILRRDSEINMLVNNAGVGSNAALVESDIEEMTRMIEVNSIAPMRLIRAVLPSFLRRNKGSIINTSAVNAIYPELMNGVYGASKAFVLSLTLSLDKELKETNINLQVVLPGAVATDFWRVAGARYQDLPPEMVMTPEDLVDAALAGFDQGELVTIPSLPDVRDWEAYECARRNLMPNLSHCRPAERYGLQWAQV